MWRLACVAIVPLCALWLIGGIASGQESRPAGQWLEWVRKQAKRERAAIQADATMAAIFRGAAVCNDPYFDPVKRKSRHAAIPTDQADIAAYEKFLAGDGKGLVQKLLAGQRAESPYLAVAQAHILWQADKVLSAKRQMKQARTAEEQAYLDAYDMVISKGRTKLTQAYRQTPISHEDLQDIRAYALYADIRCTGAKILPFQLGVMARPVLVPGDPAPDFCLPRALPVIEDPGFGAPPPFDLLRPLT